MDDRTLEERLAALEGRLARIEGVLRPGSTATPRGLAPLSGPRTWPSPPPPSPPPPAPVARVSQGSGAALEAQVGVKWVGWAGAILVVIGAALLIKYAYDQRWFGSLPPAMRLGLMSLGGLALLAAGEVVLRRVGAVAAAGLFGAGVATLFVVSYAGFEYFDLYGRNVSLAMMAAVTLVGAAVAVRGNLVSIAVLSIVGGNVAPHILGTDDPALTPLLAYLLMLQVVALVLAWWGRGPKWWMLRGLALATIVLWLAIPVIGIEQIPGQRGVVLVFALLYAGLFHAELILSALRRPVAPTYATGFAVPVPLGARDGSAQQPGLGVTFGLLVTTLLTIAVLLLFRDEPDIYRGAWTIGLAGACLGLGLILPRLQPRGLSHSLAARSSPALALAVGYRIQAAALLVVAVPVTLSGLWVTVTWAIVGVAFAAAGAMLNLAVSRVSGVLVWLLAVAHLGLWTIGAGIMGGGGGPLAIWAVLFGEPIPAYAVLATAMTLAGHAIATLVREDWTRSAVAHHPGPSANAAGRPGDSVEATDAANAANGGTHNLEYESRTAIRPVPVAAPQFQVLATFADVTAAVVFLVAAVSALPPIGQTLAILCYGWSLVAAGRFARSPVLLPAGLLLVAAAAAKWILADTFGTWLSTGYAGERYYSPIYNPAAAAGAALFASALVLLRLPLRLPAWRAQVRAASGFTAVLVLLWTVTMEIDRYFEFIAALLVAPAAADATRAKQVTISIFWSVYAVACVAFGFRFRVARLRYFGLGLFAATAVKVMIVDLSQVQTGYRILSFLGLGLLLLGTSVLYGKLGPVLLGERHTDAPT